MCTFTVFLVRTQDRWNRNLNLNLLKSQIISCSFVVRVVLTGESRRRRKHKMQVKRRNWDNNFLLVMHLTLKSCCQLLIHLGEEGREELHTGTGGMYRRRRRRRRLPQKGSASHPVKSSISSATTNSKSRATLLPFIVIWKVKRPKRIKHKGIEKLHFLVGLPIRPWDN